MNKTNTRVVRLTTLVLAIIAMLLADSVLHSLNAAEPSTASVVKGKQYSSEEQKRLAKLKADAESTSVRVNYKGKMLKQVVDDLVKQSGVAIRLGKGTITKANAHRGRKHSGSCVRGKKVACWVRNGVIDYTSDKPLPLETALGFLDNFDGIAYVYRPDCIYVATTAELKTEFTLTETYKVRHGLTREDLPTHTNPDEVDRIQAMTKRFEDANIEIDLSKKNLKEMLRAIAKTAGIRIGINAGYLKECQGTIARISRGCCGGGAEEPAMTEEDKDFLSIMSRNTPPEVLNVFRRQQGQKKNDNGAPCLAYRKGANAQGWEVMKTGKPMKLPEFFRQFFRENKMEAKVTVRPDALYITPTPLHEYIRSEIEMTRSMYPDGYVEPKIEYEEKKKLLTVTANRRSLRFIDTRYLNKSRLTAKPVWFKE